MFLFLLLVIPSIFFLLLTNSSPPPFLIPHFPIHPFPCIHLSFFSSPSPIPPFPHFSSTIPTPPPPYNITNFTRFTFCSLSSLHLFPSASFIPPYTPSHTPFIFPPPPHIIPSILPLPITTLPKFPLHFSFSTTPHPSIFFPSPDGCVGSEQWPDHWCRATSFGGCPQEVWRHSHQPPALPGRSGVRGGHRTWHQVKEEIRFAGWHWNPSLGLLHYNSGTSL